MTSPDLTIPTLTAWRASLGGVKLVPVEPTLHMQQTGLRELQDNLGHEAVIIRDPLLCYRAMLHSSPTPAIDIAALLDLCIGMAEALRPFVTLVNKSEAVAREHGRNPDDTPDAEIVVRFSEAGGLTAGDFRRARTALQPIGERE